MATPRQSSLRTAKRRAAWSLACCAATILLLVSQGVESPWAAAQGPSVLEGTLEVQYEDSYAGARLTHYLNTGSEHLALRFAKKPPGRLQTGARVRVRGARRNGALMVDTGADVSSLSDDASNPGSGVSSLGLDDSGSSMLPLSSSNTFGAQSTLVILFNFQDFATQPYSTASAQSVTFNEVSNFFRENSFGQTWLEGAVVGWYTIAATSTVCNYNTWAAQAEQAATDAGVNLGAYSRRVFGFPQTASCSWWGLGSVGGGTVGNPSRAWINGPYALRVVGHEMGHNFGLHHARSNTCDASGCLIDEYGDDHDIMGAVTGHFNAYQKERLGWLGYGTSPAIQAVTESGQYALEPYATPNGGLPKALRILKSTTGASNTYLYAEARTQVGADTSLAPGVLIHTGIDTDGTEIYLQDLKPSTSVTDFILDPGQSVTFSDAGPPITLTALSFGATGAVLDVTVPCSFSLDPSGLSLPTAGGTGSVALSTSTSCAWTATSHDSWITLNAGSTGGIGPSTISFAVAANPSASIRTGTLTIEDQTFTVTQQGASCNYIVSPTSRAFNYTGGIGTLSVTTSSGCTWPATSDETWITITAGAGGSGSGNVTYTVASNSTAHTARSGTLTIAGQTVTVTQEGLAALFSLPVEGMNPVATSSLFIWSFVSGAQRYVLTIGTTPGGADLWDTGEVAQTSAPVTNLPASRLLYARVRTKFDATTWTQSDISFTTVDHASSLQVLGAQTPSPVVAGQSTQYGTSAGSSTQIAFTGSGGGCTTELSASGLPSGASATFVPGSVTSSAINQFSLLTIATTTATPPGSYTFTVKAQETGMCGSGFVTTAVPLIVSNSSTTATTLTPAPASGPYGGSSAVSATLNASGSPVNGKTIAFTLNGSAVGTALTNASGVATLATASLAGLSAGSYPAGAGASFAGDGSYSASSGTGALTVSQKSVTPAIAAANKPYNSTTSATLTSCTLSGLLSGDVANCTGIATFATASVGAGKTVTASGLTLTGAAAGNYVLSTTTATTTAAITAALVTPTVTVANKVYDGTTSATLTSCTLSGLVSGEMVSCTGTATFATASVGTGKTVTVSGLTLSGVAAGNYALTTTTATTTATITAAPGTGLVAAYAFSEGTGLTVGDASGSGNIGTLTAATWTPAGKYGSALSFNGSSARVTIPDAASLRLTTAMTLEAWVNPSSVTAAWQDVIYKGDDNYLLEATSDISAQPAAGGMFGTTGVNAFGPAALGVNTWTHLAATYDGAALRLYVNGTQVSSVARTGLLTTSTNPLQLGGDSIYGQYFAGLIDEVRVYNVALTAAQIQADMATPVGGVAPTPDLTVTKTHVGGFTQGQTGATYTVMVGNAGTGPTSAAVTLVDTLPSGLTATALTGSGWSCTVGTLTCTRSDALAAGTSYPVVTVTVTVASTAPASVTNQATVSGGGETNTANDTASDPTLVASSVTATTLAPAAASGIYGGSSGVAATLSAAGSPVSGKTIAFTLNGTAVGTAVTNASGVATLATASLAGLSAGNYPSGVGASFAGDGSYGASSGTSALTVSQKSVTPTVIVANKAYDGTTSATLASCTLSGLLSGDVVSCTGTATFATASVGAGKTVTVSGLGLGGPAQGNYVLSTTTATTTAVITAAPVTPTVTVANKAYDGTTSATLTSCTLSGLVSGEIVSCTGTATFATASVGTGKTVTVSGLTLSGVAAGNYVLTTTTATTTATITAAMVTSTVAAYAFSEGTGTTVADASGNGNIGTLTGATWTAAGKYGAALAFNGSSARVTIPDAAALRLTTAMTLEAWVNPSSVTAAWQDVIYKGDDNYLLEATSGNNAQPAAGGMFGTTGVNAYGPSPLGVNTWTHLAATYDGAVLRLYVNGTSVSSIARTGALTTSTNPLQLGGDSIYGQYFAGLIDEVRVYNVALTAAQIQADMATPIGGVAPTPDLTVTKTHAGGFTQGQTGATYTVTVGNAGTGPTSAAVTLVDTLPNGLTATGLAGTGWSCTVGTLTCTRSDALAAGTSYPVVTVTVTVATTAPASLTNQATVSGGGETNTTNDSASDLTLVASSVTATTLAPAAASGLYGGSSAVSATLSAAGSPVSGKTIAFTLNGTAVGTAVTNASGVATLATASLAGLSAGNYPSGVGASFAGDGSYGASSGTSALTVSQKSVTPTVIVANKAYDGTTSATLASCTLSGLLSGDVVSCTGTATFATASVGAGKTVTVSGLGLGGPAQGNYVLSTTTATTTAAITGATVTPTVTVANKIYNGQLGATLTSCTLAGIAGTDDVSCTGGTATFATASVGAGKTVTVSGLTLTGAAAGNYVLSSTTATTAAAITAAPVTPTVTVANKVYDGTTSATLTSCTLSGLVSGDVVNCTGTATFATASVGTGKTVTVSGLTLTGAAAGNYALTTTTATTTATITAAPGTGLVAAYAFSEGTGLTVGDASGSGNVGTLANATWTAAGKYGAALSFNGSSARVTIPDAASLHLTTAMTLEAWVNPSTVSSAWRDVIYKGDDNYLLEATSDNNAQPAAGGKFGTIGVNAYGPSALAVNTWTHLAVTYDGAVLRLYVNGTSVSSVARTGSLTTSTNPLQLGGDSIYGQYFAGLIDEVRVYNVALTAAQIQADMATPVGGVAPTPDLTVTKTHAGGFTQGQTGATYTVTVGNAGTGPTSGAVTLVDTLPSGLTATALTGSGWSCTVGTLTCTRSDALAAGTSYPAVTVTVTVASTAPATVTNQATVSGGGETNTANDSASDLTSIARSTTGLVAAYSFNEGSGTTTTDASGTGNIGTLINAAWTTTGKYGGGLVFNGTSALVSIPDTTSLHLTTAMTLEAWVNPSVVTSAWQDVIYKGNDNYFLEAASPGSSPVVGGTFGATGVELHGTTALSANTWTHLAATYDGATLRLFVNGTQVSSEARTGSLAISTNPLQIGGDSIYGQHFQGTIDEVRVYNVALTAAQIQADMNTPTAP